MNQSIQTLLFPELHEAIIKGYTDHFNVLANGLLQCLSNPPKCYEINEVNVETITCSANKATLYLVTTLDGLFKGLLVDYWEC